jgi:uncharacterized cupredoxin-like copper-binding protein
MLMFMRLIILLLFIALINTKAFAASMKEVGMKGKSSDVSKTINIKMFDNYFEPKIIEVKKGQTVKFIIENRGKLVHEFNIATMEMHKKHEPEMKKMMKMGILLPTKINKNKMMQMSMKDKSMSHSHANSILLEPKQKGELIWKFNSNIELYGGCNVPGHLEAGMVSRFKFN